MESKQGYLVHKVYRLEKGSSFIAHNVVMAKLQHEGWKKVVAKESRTTEASTLRMAAEEMEALPKEISRKARSLRMAAGEQESLPNLRRKFSVVGGAGTRGARIENPPRASWFVSGANHTATTLSSKT